MESYYKDVTIDIMVHNYNNIDIHSEDYPTIKDLEDRFGIELENTKILKMDLPSATSLKEHYKNKRNVERVTKEYDLFINFMFLSKHQGKAPRNIYMCMFPPQKYKFDKSTHDVIGNVLDLQFKRSYNYFITNSLFTNHWQQHYWNTGNKNRIIYPPVFSETEMVEVDLAKKENVILSVGRFFVGAHNKKQDILVDFFIDNYKKFEGWELHLIGALSNNPVDLEYVNSIKNKIENHPIYLHINIPLVQVDELYSKAKLFWHATGLDEESDKFPDKMEHFGITTVEAMSNGVVPIVINKGGQTEIVNHELNGYLWDNKEQLLKYSLELIADSNKRELLALKAIERAEFFSVENFYKHNEEIFDAL
jgi:glycosyltransferase involved in cell wall biosynthesis